MANTKTSDLPNASALTGAEEILGVQGGANVKITQSQIRTFAKQNLVGADVAAYSVSGEKIAKSFEDNNANTFTDPGVYFGFGGFSTNLPNNSQHYAIIVVRGGAFNTQIWQTAIQLNGAGIGDIYVRSSVDATPSGWNSWTSANT